MLIKALYSAHGIKVLCTTVLEQTEIVLALAILFFKLQFLKVLGLSIASPKKKQS